MSASHQPIHCAVIIGVGASKAIVAAVCRRIAREGLLVYVVGRTAHKVESIAAEIQQAGGQVIAHILDATNLTQVSALFADIAAKNQIVDLTINIVGRHTPSHSLRTSTKFFDLMRRMTIFSDFLVSQQAILAMLPQQKGTLKTKKEHYSMLLLICVLLSSSGQRATRRF